LQTRGFYTIQNQWHDFEIFQYHKQSYFNLKNYFISMCKIAYHASQEQFAPSQLLKFVELAEQAGFTAIHSSDHFHPWSLRQAQSGFTFSWIAAAMHATQLPFSMVCAPGQRYHPAIVAQALATLAEMFPGRIDVELGSGEALNEMITGDPWLDKDSRNKRLLECAQIIRRLLNGEEVSFSGLIKVKEAKLYTLPRQLPKLFCAALSAETAAWAGKWADGLLTTSGSKKDMLKKKEAFENNGGHGKPLLLQLSFSYAHTKKEAEEEAYHQWRTNACSTDELADLYKPEHFDERLKNVSIKDVAEKTNIITSISELAEHINVCRDVGAQRVVLHNVSRKQEIFITDFGNKIHDFLNWY
jgi:coenzyme F420-dependent glucose-6-phosphate dehydrogenase